MRLVIVTRRFWPVAGGVERAIAHLGAALVARGTEVTLITTQWDQSWPERIDYRGISVSGWPRKVGNSWANVTGYEICRDF